MKKIRNLIIVFFFFFMLTSCGEKTLKYDDTNHWLEDSKGKISELKPHNFLDWNVTLEPTCILEGEMVRKCSECDHFETDIISKLEHVEIISKPGLLPTVNESGLTDEIKCSSCNQILKEAVSISPITSSEGLKYAFDEELQGYWVTSIGSCSEKDVIIGLTYKNYPIIGIYNSAFEGAKKIKSVKIIL